MKLVIKSSFHIIGILFALSLLSVIFLKDSINNDLYKSIIDCSFWNRFGLLSGYYIVYRIISQKETENR